MLRRLTLIGVVWSALVTVVTVGACATMNVSSHVERGLDFSRYRTYAWGPADALPTGDPRLDADPFFRDRVQGAVERRLAGLGFEQADSGPADLLIHYHASITERIDVVRADQRYGYCYTEECKAGVIAYEAGTLVVDVVDVRTNQVAWRGWAQDSVGGVLGNRERMSRRIDEAVRRMFERFPGGLSRVRTPDGVPF